MTVHGVFTGHRHRPGHAGRRAEKNPGRKRRGRPVWPICGRGMDWMELGSKPKAHSGIENRLDKMIHACVEREWEAMMWEME